MRLVLLGNPRLQRSWKNCLAHAARLLGWDVTMLQDDAVTVGRVIAECSGADMLLWARSHGHSPSGDVESMWRAVEAGGTKTAAVHLDLYWGVPHRQAQIGRDPWWLAQHVFTADGNPAHRALFEQRGVNHHWLVPPAADRYAHPGRYRSELAYDMVFVGSCGRVHDQTRRRMLDWATQRYGNRFCWLGRGGRAGIWGQDLADLYASAKVVLGDSVPNPYYWSDRVSNTLGMGGVLVHPEVDGLADQYGAAVGTWPRGNLTALGDLVDGLLDNPIRRSWMRGAGAMTAMGRHLWRHRLPEIARVCGIEVS
ncbi:glycosyltransferase [Micromonospora sp. WMMD1102]|uniref:glycosyltransferase family protein n=1 Tax=Micromonospora sp. WMMD1102 TaxID=3016105 RepID=UPI0024158C40|nr:glycosyltransferase [Micromonospora sp. WMMD1102]MDG4792011.1 glycosyltransferase [Micromonospora sp. WMMD1102]